MKKFGIKIYAAGRDVQKMQKRFSKYIEDDLLHFVTYDATKNNSFDFSVDYIIHGANNAYPSVFMKFPVETMLDNFTALYELLEYAKRTETKKVVFISSSEIYGKKELEREYEEGDYGFIDILNPRSCYSNSKRAGETLCACYHHEYGVNAVSIRPGHIYGPTATRTDSRVSSAFAFDAADGKEIVMKSRGEQIRSYCYMLDSATSILMVVARGKSGEAYNISNPNSVISIKEMATILSEVSGVSLRFSLPTTDDKQLFNPMDNSSLNSTKLHELGWTGLFDSQTGFKHTVQIIRESGI